MSILGMVSNNRAPPKPKIRDYLSFSSISTFQSCPLKYYFRYVAGLPEESLAASLVFGSALHSVVQFHFEQLLQGSGSHGLDTLLEVFQDAWKAKTTAPIRFGKREDFDSYCRLADRVLKAFFATDWANPKGQIIAVEEELRGSILSGGPEMVGRLDLLVEDSQEYVLTDFKTSSREWAEGRVIDAAPQLVLYQELLAPLLDRKPLRLQFAVLTKTKEPRFTLHPVQVHRHHVYRFKKVIERIWQAIQVQHFYPNPSPLQCPTCPYRRACGAWNG